MRGAAGMMLVTASLLTLPHLSSDAFAAQAPATADAPYWAVVTGTTVNVRSGPSAQSAYAFGKLRNGDVVRVLRDEQGIDAFEVPMDELLAEAARKARIQAPMAAHLHWTLHATPGPALDNRAANLALLVLENLCVNAAQALHGRGSITLKAAPTPAHSWRIEVEDSGPGIPEAARERLFIPQNSSKPGGSGLGLALSRHLARHLGGDLLLDHSSPGLTRFVLTLPIQRPSA